MGKPAVAKNNHFNCKRLINGLDADLNLGSYTKKKCFQFQCRSAKGVKIELGNE